MNELCRRFVLIIAILCFNFAVSAQNGGSFVTVSYQKDTLKDVLDDISSQTGFLFVYNSSQVDDKVTLDIKVKHKDLEQVLTKISEILDFQYIITEKQIIPLSVLCTRWTVHLAS